MTLRPASRPAPARSGEIGRFVVPIGDRGVLRWFLAHLHVEHGFTGRLRHALLRAAAPWAPGVERALFEWRGPTREGDPAIAAARVAVDALGDAISSAPFERWIVMRDDLRESRGRVIVFPFSSRARAPSGVLRVRGAGAGPTLARESAALTDVRARLSGDLLDTLPEILARREVGELEVQLETLLPGRSAYVEMRESFVPSRRADRHLRAAADWLSEFHAATRSADGSVAVHGDFWPRNLLLDRHGTATGVVDWEWYRPSGKPFRDLFDFPVGYALAWPWADERRRDPLEALSRAFIGPGRVFRSVAAYFARYAEATGLDLADIESAFPDFVEGRSRARREEVPWSELRRRIETADRSVFSG